MENHRIRFAVPSDSEAILKIYAPYVRDTAVSFETEVPSVPDFAFRIASISEQYPYLVYQVDGVIVGYAYAARHRERAAYCYDAELSVYVSPEYHGSGAAHKLYACLLTLLQALGYRNVYAAYTVPNGKSAKFHQKFGFTEIGTHRKTGYKLGQWHDVCWLELAINEHSENPEPPKAVGELAEEFVNAVFSSALQEV